MSTLVTPKLNIKRVQQEWQFGDEAFNRVIDDMDNRLVGVSHLGGSPHWQEWEAATTYVKDDVVRYPQLKSHQYLSCIVGGVSGDIAPTASITGTMINDGTVKWEISSLTDSGSAGGDIQIWLGGGTYYTRGQAVIYGSALYRCTVDHFSSSAFSQDLIKWQEIKASLRLWQPLVYYFADDVVIYDNKLYKCITAHTSSTSFTTAEEANWEMVSGKGGTEVADWEEGKDYEEGNIVLVNNVLYKANTAHTSSSSFDTDIANWDAICANLSSWASSAYYPSGIIVEYDGALYKCTTAHTSTSTFDETKWEQISGKGTSISEWERNTEYEEDEIVIYNNCLYICTTAHTSVTTFALDSSNWKVLFSHIQEWKPSVYYFEKDTVLYGSDLYICTTAHTSASTFTSDRTNWESTYIGLKAWAGTTYYKAGTIVYNDGILYRCLSAHTSSSVFSSDSSRWAVLNPPFVEWTPSTTYYVGMAVTYGGEGFICATNHTSGTSFEGDSFSNYWTPILYASVEDYSDLIRFKKGNLVRYNNALYLANADGTGTFPALTNRFVESLFDVVYANIRPYVNSQIYKAGDMVIYNNRLYRCVETHTANRTSIEEIQLLHEYFSTTPSFNDATTYPYTQIFLFPSIPDRGAEVIEVEMLQEDATNNTDKSYFETIRYYIGDANNQFTLLEEISNIEGEGIVYGAGNLRGKYIKVEIDSPHFEPNGLIKLQDLKVKGKNPYWELVGEQETAIIKEWESDTIYESGSIVLYDNILYRCQSSHKSLTTFDEEHRAWWKPILPSVPNWETGKRYWAGQYINKDGKLYKCNTDHTSTTFVDDASNFDFVNANIPDWVAGNSYKTGDIVIHDDRLYQCLQSNDNSTWTLTNYWKEISAANDVRIENWLTATYYSVGSLVEYDNQIYKCKVAHTSDVWEDEMSNWQLLSGIRTWDVDTVYSADSLVYYNKKIYKVVNNFTSGDEFDTTNLIKINSDLQEWEQNHEYLEDDVIIHNNQLYIVRYNFTSGSTFSEEYLLEKLAVKNWKKGTAYLTGNYITYNNSLYEVTSDFISSSTFDATNLSGVITTMFSAGADYEEDEIIKDGEEYYKVLEDFTSKDRIIMSKLEKCVPDGLTEEQIDEIAKYYNPPFMGQTMFIVQDNAGAHNALYYEEDLTDYFDSGEMSERIADGTFKGIFPGGYIRKSIVVDGTTYTERWFVADLNYFLHSGDTELTTNHVVLLPENALGNSQMNTSNTISGGYNNTYMWKTTIPKYSAAILNSFGSDHVIQNYRALISTGNSNSASAAGGGLTGTTNSWAFTTIPVANIPTEPMVYGGMIWSSSGYDTSMECSQLALLRHRKDLICTKQMWYWLRAASNSTTFAYADNNGFASHASVSLSGRVRPFFLLC